MINRDKFGHTIYPSRFRLLKANEKVLLITGYLESRTKPNLLYKVIPEGCLFADMRGTEEVPIWEDTRPLFYWNINDGIPGWKARRVVRLELEKLFRAGSPCRLSGEVHDDPLFEESGGIFVDESEGVFYWNDGYCKECGKDFQGEGEFCSKECEVAYTDRLKKPCEACGKKIDFREEITHHVSYFPEKTILVHRSCHTRIHRSDAFPHLRPTKEDIDRFYSRSKVE